MSRQFIESFEQFGPVDAHGAAMAWLAHIDMLKFIIQNRWSSALVLEDDVDWSVEIREQTRKVAEAVVRLTQQNPSTDAPYGLDWDVIWMGHCGDRTDLDIKLHVTYQDPTVISFERYRSIDNQVTTQLREGHRAVHFSTGPICTWAYGVSAEGARKLLAEASKGQGGAYDLMLMSKCKEEKLRCITVNIQLFDAYHPAEGGQSEVRAGDSSMDLQDDFGASPAMGHTDNVLESARCAGLFSSTCLSAME
jgi:hypothetical protein